MYHRLFTLSFFLTALTASATDCKVYGKCVGVGPPTGPCNAGQTYIQADAMGVQWTCSGIPAAWHPGPSLIGPQGPRGLTGATGPIGPVGPTGVTGPIGPIGPQGPAGVQGPAGTNGAAGAQGPKGDAGPAGQTGPAGAQGAVGAQGATGAAGATGPLNTADVEAYQVVTPACGSTVTMTAGKAVLSIKGTLLLAALTVKLPPSPTDGQIVHIVSQIAVTLLTVQDSTGATVGTSIALGALSAGDIWQYQSTGWVRLA